MPEKPRRPGRTYHVRLRAGQVEQLATIARWHDLPVCDIWRLLVGEEHERLLAQHGPAIGGEDGNGNSTSETGDVRGLRAPDAADVAGR